MGIFNCHTKNVDFSFHSNPKMLPVPVIVPKDVDGKTVNHVVYQAVSNRSLLDGCHFDESIHGLRAKLNLGVKLSEVPNPNVDDFASAFGKLNEFYDSYEDARTRIANAKAEESVEK